MALQPTFIVKVCGVTSVSDARWAVECGANALGFNFYSKSPRYVALEEARNIATNVPGNVLRVGVFVNATVEQMLSVAEAVRLDVLQLHGSECAIPSHSRYRIWRSLPAGSATPQKDERIEAYLLDTPTPDYGGSGRTFDWDLAAAFPHPAILAGGLDGDNVPQAIARVKPWGVDACSRLEEAPGRKHSSMVSHFVSRAWSAARQLDLEEANI